MNILQLNNLISLSGGSETVMENISFILRSKGHQVWNMGYSRSGVPTMSNSISLGEAHYSISGFFFNSNLVREIISCIKHNSVDLIICHNIYHKYPMWQLFKSLKELGVPVILILHDSKIVCPWGSCQGAGGFCHSCKNGRFYHLILNRCREGSYMKSSLLALDAFFHVSLMDVYSYPDLIVSPSQFIIDLANSMGNKHPIKRLPNPIDVENLERRSHCYDNKVIKIMFAGRFTEEKGCRLIKDYAIKNQDIQFFLAGAGPMEDEINSWSNKMPNLTNLGFLKKDELYAYFNQVDFLIIPSLVYENNPMIILEAMSVGLPVVGADYGGIRELLMNNRGFLYNNRLSGAEISIFSHLRRLTDEQYQEMSQTAFEFAHQFSIERYYQRWQSLVEGIIEKNSN